MNAVHQKFLDEAVVLARRGRDVSPNPRVGALVVKRGRVIARGWHKQFGGPHAEVIALEQLPKGAARGAIVYVSLEPCVGWKGKKTPSCAKQLVQEKVGTVVVGMRDPHPRVQGRGVAFLEKHGIRVVVAPPRAFVHDVNHEYLLRIARESHERPFVLLKTAMSVDGKIGTPNHRSVALSTPEDRRAVDRLRAACDAIMVGGVTFRHDAPRLTVKDPRLIHKRIADGRDPQPLTVVVRSGALIVGREHVDRYVFPLISSPFRKGGLRGILNKVDVKQAMSLLAIRYGVRLLMVEGGGELNFSMLESGCVNLLRIATAPMILGGRTAPTLVDGGGIDARHPLWVKLLKREKLGNMDVVWYHVLNVRS